MRKSTCLVFALIFSWKLALFLFSTQPVPANDAFFYDGAAVHELLYGGFYNPPLVHAFPIGGAKIFSGYPPLYQVPLLAWLSIFGISAKSVVALHLVLFGGYMLALVAIFKQLAAPAWCANLAAAFLLLMTFHDRPDSLAQLFGILAVYALIRSRRILNINGPLAAQGNRWTWWMALFVFLCLCTSLQIGAVYLLAVFAGTTAACYFGKEPLPWLPLLLLLLVPTALVIMVKTAFPLAWAGFREHAQETPSLTGFRIPTLQEILKILRSLPGIALILLFLPFSWFKQPAGQDTSQCQRYELVMYPLLLAAVAISGAALILITPNAAGIASYLQPVLVAAYFGICAARFPKRTWLRFQIICFSFAVLFGSVRAIGMATWGLACASDVGYSKSISLIEAELHSQKAGSTVVMSSAFLYDGVKHRNLNFVHSDWLEKAGGDSRISDLRGLLKIRPQEMILSQFDYYRRFEPVLQDAKNNPALLGIEITNTARIPAPDSLKRFQHVVQHISWAPVIVKLSWASAPTSQTVSLP